MSWLKSPPVAFRGVKGGDIKHNSFDVILISGDAYIDHPAFPAAVIYRRLEQLGLKVAIIAQPDWKNIDDFLAWGRPELFFAITAGAMDSMVSNYTATRMPRSEDRLSPGGKAGLRPKRATRVYVQKVREAFKNVPIVIGGIEASLRRFVHYDFWDDSFKDPILMEAPADFLVYGMGEVVLERIVDFYRTPEELREAFPRFSQTCVRVKHGKWREHELNKFLLLPDVETCKKDAKKFMEMNIVVDRAVRDGAEILIQEHAKGDILCFPPDKEDWLKEPEIMSSLRFTRTSHKIYKDPVPALEPVQFSIQSHRGCLGACSFCALSIHQGRFIRSRKEEDLIKEAKGFLSHPDFKGIIPDVGGPAVNMYQWGCKVDGCKTGLCTFPDECKNMKTGLSSYLKLLRSLAALKGVRKVFIGSGLRFDLIGEKDWNALAEIIENHVSGQLKVAPEHVNKKVLGLMRKGQNADFRKFVKRFEEICKSRKILKYVVPYFILAYPGSDNLDVEIVELVKELKLAHEQVQEFTPTPGSIATAMYATELSPDMKPLKVKKNRNERLESRKLLQKKTSNRKPFKKK